MAGFNGASTLTSRKGAVPAAITPALNVLQWGLDADVEEGPGAALRSTGDSWLQWGLDADVEEGPQRAGNARRARLRFNGASTLTSRKGRCRCRLRRRPALLQWALDADVEEGVAGGSAALRATALQWGLDADVEEGRARHARHHSADAWSASMGPRR